tara:strand:- start:109 stop:576 length:468 start_codon:yes stop_codon:yes gene_type:complete
MKSIAVLFFICITTNSLAQDYKTAIGIKGGYPGYGTINVKHFLTNTTAIEGSLGGLSRSSYGNGAFIMAVYEIQNALEEGFSWFYGGGALFGFTNQSQNNSDSFFHSGFNGTLGLEYTFDEVPINCSLNTGPILFLTPRVQFNWGGGLAIRYAIR